MVVFVLWVASPNEADALAARCDFRGNSGICWRGGHAEIGRGEVCQVGDLQSCGQAHQG